MKTLIVVLALLGSARMACGHGFTLSLSGNSLLGNSGGANPHLFSATLSATNTSTHGGAGDDTFGVGKTLSFDVFTPLWYSSGDGNPAQLADSGISLTIESASLTGEIAIDRTSTTTAGFDITGDTSHEFLWTLAGPITPGFYGVGYRVEGSPDGGSPYVPTPLLVSVFMTNGFAGGTTSDPLSPLSLARNAIYGAAVPEPSGIVLAAFAIVALSAFGWRRAARVRCA